MKEPIEIMKVRTEEGAVFEIEVPMIVAISYLPEKIMEMAGLDPDEVDAWYFVGDIDEGFDDD